MTTIIDGKAAAARVRAQVKAEVEELNRCGIVPGLAVVAVGENSASQVYVASKERACREVGIFSETHYLPEGVAQEEIIRLIHRLNQDPRFSGVLLPLPLPAYLNERTVTEAVSPYKDVDCCHLENIGRMTRGDYRFLPCTPAGVMELLHQYGVEIAGKHCVVIGRSNIVGKPLALLLMHEHGTVTICHSVTQDMADITRGADILITAVGRENLITGDMVKEGAVVIDVGINRNERGKLCGDVEFGSVSPRCSAITPVPGGVGPMTIAMLLKNILTAAKNA